MTLKNNQINVNLRQKTSLIDNRGGFLTIYKTNNHNKNRSENLKKSHHIHNTNIFFSYFSVKIQTKSLQNASNG